MTRGDTTPRRGSSATTTSRGTSCAKSRKETGENLNAYHCETCHSAHLGHTPGMPRRIEGWQPPVARKRKQRMPEHYYERWSA